jgi:hypothetical protein
MPQSTISFTAEIGQNEIAAERSEQDRGAGAEQLDRAAAKHVISDHHPADRRGRKQARHRRTHQHQQGEGGVGRKDQEGHHRQPRQANLYIVKMHLGLGKGSVK